MAPVRDRSSASFCHESASALDSGVVSAEPLLPPGDAQLPVGERRFLMKRRQLFASFQFGSRFFRVIPRDSTCSFFNKSYFRAEEKLKGKEWSLSAGADANHACLQHFQPL